MDRILQEIVLCGRPMLTLLVETWAFWILVGFIWLVVSATRLALASRRRV